MSTATVLVPPSNQLFGFAIIKIYVSRLSTPTAPVVPVVDNCYPIKDEAKAIIACCAQVVHLVVGWEQPTIPTDHHIFGDIGAHDIATAPLVFNVG